MSTTKRSLDPQRARVQRVHDAESQQERRAVAALRRNSLIRARANAEMLNVASPQIRLVHRTRLAVVNQAEND
jgi:hypothetical protein